MSCNCVICKMSREREARAAEPLTESTLYIVMRTDLNSMNPGKAMAQTAHAGQQFQEYMISNGEHKKILKEFNGERNFGRTIVLGGPDGSQFLSWLVSFYENGYHIAGIVNDPTYPLKDGTANLAIVLDTCLWVFVEKGQVPPKELHELELHA